MARFQTLPDRVDCICVSVPDSQMCQNHGVSLSCNLTVNCCTVIPNTKTRFEKYIGCCLWTVPAGICQIFIEMWGAGGGGAGHGNCCCCSAGTGGSAGAYAAIQITTTPGCQYTVCAGTGGNMGCGCNQGGSAGNTSYVNGYNLCNFCATGGSGSVSLCNDARSCFGANCASASVACANASAYQNNVFVACGEGGHLFGKPQGCRFENKGGSAPFNGGIGEWNTYNQCCVEGEPAGRGGGFPGGGASGSTMSCVCSQCKCGGCGAGGFVRIWY